MSVQPSGTIRSTPTQMRLLDTAAPGINLAAASKLVTLPGAGSFPWPFITPDGTKLIGEMGHRPARTGTITESGALGVYSARTGTLLQVIGRWQQHGPAPRLLSHARQAVVWSNPSGSRLIVEMPRGKLNQVGILTGDKFGAPADRDQQRRIPDQRRVRRIRLVAALSTRSWPLPADQPERPGLTVTSRQVLRLWRPVTKDSVRRSAGSYITAECWAGVL
jgi:hypothetical protein